MPTTNTNFSTLITAIDTKAQSLAASTTDPKDLVFLGKAVEALNVSDTVSSVIAEGDTQVAAVAAQGVTSIAAVAAQGSGYASLADPTFSGTMNAANVILSGNLTVNGTTTTINTATLDVEDKNITVAKGAADSAAANGGGLTVDGAGATFNYASSGDKWTTNKPLDVTGAVTATGAAINGTLKTNEIIEKATLDTTTSGTLTVDTTVQSVVFLITDQTANRTINFSNVSANLAVGESISFAIMCRQGGTAYYLNAYQVDGSTATPKWQGGSAPTGGNTQSVDIYTFTLIRTSSAIEVFASVNEFGT